MESKTTETSYAALFHIGILIELLGCHNFQEFVGELDYQFSGLICLRVIHVVAEEAECISHFVFRVLSIVVQLSGEESLCILTNCLIRGILENVT